VSSQGGSSPGVEAPARRAGQALLRLAALFALLAAAFTAGSRIAAPGYAAPLETEWKEYQVLLAEASIPEGELLVALSSAGFRRVLSASTQPVLVSDWVGLETMPLSLALERLLEGDPRRDPYIESLGSWFEASVGGKPYRAYYLPATRALGEAALSKALAPFHGRFLLPGLRPASEAGDPRLPREGLPSLAATTLLLVAAALISLLHTGRRKARPSLRMLLLRLSAGLPWLAAASSGFPLAAQASLWGLALVELSACLELPLDEYLLRGSLASAFDSLRRQARPPLALAAAALASLFLEPASLPSIGLAFMGSLSALAACALALRIAGSAEGRRPFIPRPIGRRLPARVPASPWLACLACLALGLWTFDLIGAQAHAGPEPSSLAYPRPAPVEGSPRPGPEEARKRARASGGGRLPDLASWLEHRAIQEALPLERVGDRRPEPFEPVAVARPGGEELALRFDEDWVRAAYRSLPPLSVEGMLAAQEGSVAAFSRAGGAGKGRPLASIEVLRYILLLIPPLGRIAAGLWAARGSGTRETRQEA